MSDSPYFSDEELEQVARDAIERYRRAVELVDGAREAWEEAGQPLTVEWPNGVVSEAPLLKLLRAAERDCDRLARSLPKPPARPGRKPSAVVKPPRSTLLRAAK
jgi:hypothetical protein